MDDLASGADDLVRAGYDGSAAAAASATLTRYAAARVPIARSATGLLPATVGFDDDGRL